MNSSNFKIELRAKNARRFSCALTKNGQNALIFTPQISIQKNIFKNMQLFSKYFEFGTMFAERERERERERCCF